MRSDSYFTEYTYAKGIFYLLVFLYVIACSISSLLQPFISLPCDASVIHRPPSSYQQQLANGDFENPGYIHDLCYRRRFGRLCFLTVEECSFSRRILFSVVFGGIIGWERRQADRPAGIRTMSLVSLGSCLFTLTSAYAFLNGPMNWDGSRVAAAIPSGVGFLGAGLIWKQSDKDHMNIRGDSSPYVHGLTTAASVWLSAAVGIACGGAMYFTASFSVGLMLLLLRFGPRITPAASSVTVTTVPNMTLASATTDTSPLIPLGAQYQSMFEVSSSPQNIEAALRKQI